MNKLEDFFWNKEKKCFIQKWHHYLKIYDRHFSKFIGKNPTILEIGVDQGGSLEMWNDYFNNNCTIFALDINHSALDVPKKLNATNINVAIGDQGNKDFWREYLKDKPKFDIVIDDGGHYMHQQINTYEEVYEHMTDNGVYVCEDMHTSYWPIYGGRFHKHDSFLEYTKQFIDMINIYHIQNEKSNLTMFKDGEMEKYERFRKTTNSIHYYDSVIVLEKNVDLEMPKTSRR